MTFVVRITSGDGSTLSGIVERVRTGAKERFDDLAALATAIERMAREETAMRAAPEPNVTNER